MFISVVMPTYNLLEDCIKVLSPEVQNPTCDYEVIVSDDRIPSTAKPMIEEKYPWAKWVEGKHKGVAANRNNGVTYAKGDWIVFIDNDCIPDKNLINTYIQAIKDYPDIVAFEGRISADRPKRHFLEEAPINETGGLFWTCNVMINKDYFENILHGFDENFVMYMEDVDLRERIKENHQTILFLPEAFVMHPWRIVKNPIEMARQRMFSYKYYEFKNSISKKKFLERLRNELRFYFKDTLTNVVKYRCRGLYTYIKIHIFESNLKNKNIDFTKDNIENWKKLY